jgi:hypothetical protein
MQTQSAPDAPVMEIVTFRLAPGTDPAAFRAAALVTDRLLSANPAYGPRALTCDEAGLWTDIVHWSSLAAAQAAAEAMMASPECAPFMAMLDMGSVSMRHAAVIWARD